MHSKIRAEVSDLLLKTFRRWRGFYPRPVVGV